MYHRILVCFILSTRNREVIYSTTPFVAGDSIYSESRRRCLVDKAHNMHATGVRKRKPTPSRISLCKTSNIHMFFFHTLLSLILRFLTTSLDRFASTVQEKDGNRSSNLSLENMALRQSFTFAGKSHHLLSSPTNNLDDSNHSSYTPLTKGGRLD